jgi:hypothetical protein
MRIRPPLLLLPLAALVAACGADARDEAAYRESAQQAVRDAVLTVSDLPDGWTLSEIGPQALAELQLTGECAILNSRGAGFPGEIASADAEPMTGPKNEEMVNTVSAFRDTPAAEAAVRQADALVLQCRDQLGEALKHSVDIAAKDLGVEDVILDIDGTVEPGSFKTFGDETLAYILKADISTLFGSYDVNGKILIIRDGPLTGVLIYAILDDLDPQNEESLAALLARKLAAAEEALAN